MTPKKDSKKLKVILVTSQLTYIPENYLGLLESFLKSSAEYTVGVIFLKNLDFSLLKTIFGLRYLGARRIQNTVIKNIVNLPKMKREALLDSYKIKSRYFKSMNDSKAIQWCKQLGADLIVNARTRCIYKSEILETPRLGCINIHHGLLPKYRGTMNDLYALFEDRKAGFSIHRMNRKIDDGVIYHTQETSQENEKDYLKYIYESSLKEGEALAQFVHQINASGELPKGQPNTSEEIIFTKNPTRKLVQKMIKKGMIL